MTAHALASRTGQALSETWRGNLDSATVARHWAMNRLAAEGGDARWRAGQVIAELIANALRHTHSGEPGGRFTVTVDTGGPWIWIAVTDEGSVTVPVASPQPPDLLVEGGMGLHLVSEFSVEWGHEPYGTGRITWATIAR